MEAAVQLKSLSEQIYEFLSESIIEGRILPGERLVEKELCRKFGTSRSPIRECFRVLESEGLIVLHPRKGAIVRELTPKDIKDVFEVRAPLESLAAKLAVPNIRGVEIKQFNELIRAMDEALDNKDIKSFLRLNFTFHSIFIRASDNQILAKTLRSLGKGIWSRFAFLYYQYPWGLDYSNRIHKRIIKAFKEKDSEAAERLVKEHIGHAKQVLLKYYESSPNRVGKN